MCQLYTANTSGCKCVCGEKEVGVQDQLGACLHPPTRKGAARSPLETGEAGVHLWTRCGTVVEGEKKGGDRRRTQKEEVQ